MTLILKMNWGVHDSCLIGDGYIYLPFMFFLEYKIKKQLLFKLIKMDQLGFE